MSKARGSRQCNRGICRKGHWICRVVPRLRGVGGDVGDDGEGGGDERVGDGAAERVAMVLLLCAFSWCGALAPLRPW